MKPLIIVVSFDNDALRETVQKIRDNGKANARSIDASRWDLSPESDAHGYIFIPSDHDDDNAFASKMEAAGLRPYDGDLEADTSAIPQAGEGSIMEGAAQPDDTLGGWERPTEGPEVAAKPAKPRAKKG